MSEEMRTISQLEIEAVDNKALLLGRMEKSEEEKKCLQVCGWKLSEVICNTESRRTGEDVRPGRYAELHRQRTWKIQVVSKHRRPNFTVTKSDQSREHRVAIRKQEAGRTWE